MRLLLESRLSGLAQKKTSARGKSHWPFDLFRRFRVLVFGDKH